MGSARGTGIGTTGRCERTTTARAGRAGPSKQPLVVAAAARPPVPSVPSVPSVSGSASLETYEAAPSVMDSVVKVFCVHTQPNYSLPWQRKRQFSSTSSGFMVKGPKGENWLLTNAHSVEYHSQVKIKKRGDDRKFIAKVLSIGEECDVALLSVEDDEFWEGTQPIFFGDLPALQDSVFVVGYPIGGDTISVTSGVVSRIEVTSYAHGASELLAVQIDAAITAATAEDRCSPSTATASASRFRATRDRTPRTSGT